MGSAPRHRKGQQGQAKTATHAVLYVAIGLVLAAVALWTLVKTVPSDPGTAAAPEAPHGEIDYESRQQLREILRGADAGDRGEAR